MASSNPLAKDGRSAMTKVQVRMRPVRLADAAGDDIEAPDRSQFAGRLLAHFVPPDHSGPLRPGCMDFAMGQQIRPGQTDTSYGAMHPGGPGRLCGTQFATRSDMLRQRRHARRSEYFANSERVMHAVSRKIDQMADRFGVPKYIPAYDLDGDGVR